MMTIDEAIKHCYERYEQYEKSFNNDEDDDCMECAQEHRQLAMWLEELKSFKETSDPYTTYIMRKSTPKTYEVVTAHGEWIARDIDEIESKDAIILLKSNGKIMGIVGALQLCAINEINK